MKILFKNFRKKAGGIRYETANDALRTFAAVGYPKVGNTWLRMTLGKYLQEIYNLQDLPLMDSAEFPVLAAAGCKSIGEFTHYPLEWTTQKDSDLTLENVVRPFCNQRIVLLVRHPLDVLVSQYMQERYMVKGTSFSGSLTDFIEDPVFGLNKFLNFYRFWTQAEGIVSSIHFWRYEDARSGPAQSLEKLLRCLGEDIDATAIARAVDFASFDNLKAMEQSGQQDIVYKSSGLFVFGSAPKDDPNSMHVRKGVVGGYKDELAPEDAARFEAQIRSEMPLIYGYT